MLTDPQRRLEWDGCANVRDLGGLPTEDGGRTRRGAVVRSDNARRLSDAGWQALLDHGVRTVVDLRWAEELADDPPREAPIDVVHISLFGDFDEEYLLKLDERLLAVPEGAERTRASYLEFLDRYRENVARAIVAVADAPAGGVVVHCAAGKDRTGLVSALLLRLAGVAAEDVADDYAESELHLAELLTAWIAEAATEAEREKRSWLAGTPREAMLGVLAAIDERYGGVRAYLREGGATDADLDRAVARLRGPRRDGG